MVVGVSSQRGADGHHEQKKRKGQPDVDQRMRTRRYARREAGDDSHETPEDGREERRGDRDEERQAGAVGEPDELIPEDAVGPEEGNGTGRRAAAGGDAVLGWLVKGSWLEKRGTSRANARKAHTSARPTRAGRFLAKRCRAGEEITSSSRALRLGEERRATPGEVVRRSSSGEVPVSNTSSRPGGSSRASRRTCPSRSLSSRHPPHTRAGTLARGRRARSNRVSSMERIVAWAASRAAGPLNSSSQSSMRSLTGRSARSTGPGSGERAACRPAV